GAQVALTGTTLALSTDSAGHFALTGLDSGLYVIDIRAVGYAPAAWHLVLKSRQVLRQLFQMDPLPVELPEVVVTGRQPLSARRFADFERRRQAGMGAFLTQERIERANTASLVDVLVTVRGVQQVCLSNQCVAKMVRSPPGCYPQYYLDGHESSAYFARLTPPQDVKGVEIYRGSSETPGEFQGSNSGCGVIAIWTKSSP
ncbi:MAG TPA: carboxypeptidase-like regulatory domain-containing protein, partial [Gemmatimonadales bacterium]|nr:carboxypeptidase-like regulatory domain-containing protein [Gemmatimonadales bacterium]